MKLFFVIPGDRVELLEDTKFMDSGWSDIKMDIIPKGTVLEISQVYIRNHGYYQSNISFKFADGPGYDLFVQSENNRKLQALKDTHERLLKEIKDLDDHDADFTYIDHAKKRGRPVDSIFTSWEASETIYKKATFDEYVSFTAARPYRTNGYISYTYHKDTLLELAAKARLAVLNFKPKVRVPKNFCRVFRVPLQEIEKWEIKLVDRKQKV
jgi:hypothetical protein